MTDPYATSAWDTPGTTPSESTPEQVRQTAAAEGQAVAETAKSEAAAVADQAKAGAQRVTETAKSEAADVAAHTKDQVRQLATTATEELRGRAWDTHSFAAQNVRSLSDELSQLVNGEPTDGPINQLVQTAQSKGESLANWLENSDPADLVDEVRRFAARRPWAFMAIAAGAGVLAGRFARGVKDADDPQAAQSRALTTTPAKDYYARRRSELGQAYVAPTSGQAPTFANTDSVFAPPPATETGLTPEQFGDDRFGQGHRPEGERF